MIGWRIFVSFSLGLFVLTVFACDRKMPDSDQDNSPKVLNVSPVSRSLTLDDTLAWRRRYADLLGKPKETAIERYGQPTSEEEKLTLTWKEGSKTEGRQIMVLLESVGTKTEIIAVKVFAKVDEVLDPMDILKKAHQFNFTTGTYEDTVKHFFIAETKDGRNSFQFEVSDNQVRFHSMMFFSKSNK